MILWGRVPATAARADFRLARRDEGATGKEGWPSAKSFAAPRLGDLALNCGDEPGDSGCPESDYLRHYTFIFLIIQPRTNGSAQMFLRLSLELTICPEPGTVLTPLMNGQRQTQPEALNNENKRIDQTLEKITRDYWVIPFDVLKDLLVDANLTKGLTKHGEARRARWRFHIKDQRFVLYPGNRVRLGNIDVRQYYGAPLPT